MSLVEQAAKRLEQLRRAGEQVPGDVPYARREEVQGPGVKSDTTIERAARALESPDAREQAHKRNARDEARRIIPVAPGIHPEAVGEPVLEHPKRREPTLGETGIAPAPEAPIRILGVAPMPGPLELDLPSLARRGFLTPENPDSDLANQLRLIKRPLINNCQNGEARRAVKANRIMLSSALPGEGKTFLALNLAMSIAMERDNTVLLIDADTTRPGLSELLRVHPCPGLMDLLTEPELDARKVLLRTNVEKLAFLPAGNPRPSATELLASDTMQRLINEFASRYADRILIFDAPPLLSAAEPAVLAGYMGQIVIVVEADRTTHGRLQQALNAVASCPAVMTVLNKALRDDRLYQRSGSAA